jgi:hypothetical protein
MSRCRMINPQFWEDELIASWPTISRLAYIAIWNHSDDYGVVRASPTHLHSKCFPYDVNVNMKEVLKPIVDSDRLVLFNANNETYGHIPNFTKYQKINRPSKWRYPQMDGEQSRIPHEALSEDSMFYGVSNLAKPKFDGMSNQTAANTLEGTKPIDSEPLSEGYVNPQEALTPEVKLNNLSGCNKHQQVGVKPAPVREAATTTDAVIICYHTGNEYDADEEVMAKGWWEYYNQIGKESTKGWHERLWPNVMYQVLQCTKLVKDEDMRTIIRFAGLFPSRRFYEKKDLFIHPTFVFGKPGAVDLPKKLDDLLAPAKIWEASAAKRQPTIKNDEPNNFEREINKKLAAHRIEQIDADDKSVLEVFAHANEAYRQKVIRDWRKQLEQSVETGCDFFDYVAPRAANA